MSTKHISTTQITDNNKLKSIQIFLNTEYCVYQLYLLPIVKFEIPFTSKTKILSTLSPSLFLSLSLLLNFSSLSITLIPMFQSIIYSLTILSPCYRIILNMYFSTLDNVHFISRKFIDKHLGAAQLVREEDVSQKTSYYFRYTHHVVTIQSSLRHIIFLSLFT